MLYNLKVQLNHLNNHCKKDILIRNNVIFLVFGILYSRKLSPHSGGCMNPTIAIAFNLAVALVE